MENKNAQAIPADVATEIVQKINEVNNLLKPYCVVLTTEERQSILKMNDATLSFVTKAMEHAGQHPEYVPSYINLDDWKIDMRDVVTTKKIAVTLDDLNELIADTRVEAGHEAYQAALAFYHNVKRAAKEGAQGATPIYNELRTQFQSRGKRKEPAAEV